MSIEASILNAAIDRISSVVLLERYSISSLVYRFGSAREKDIEYFKYDAVPDQFRQ